MSRKYLHCRVLISFISRLSGSGKYLFLFLSCIGHAIPTLIFPFHYSVACMCINAFFFGLFIGTFHTTANVLLLHIWRGRKSSPYMYTMHLFFGFGSFITPMITKLLLISFYTLTADHYFPLRQTLCLWGGPKYIE